MAIKPVSGKIESQEINDNLSYLDSKKIDKNGLSVTDIDKNKGKLDQTYLSDELLQQMAGNTPINSVPANRSLTTNKFADKSVNANKTDFLSVSSNLFDDTNYLTDKFIDKTGNLGNHVDYITTVFLEVKPSTDYFIIKFNKVAFYDESERFLSLVNIVDDEGGEKVTTPTGTYYMRVSGLKFRAFNYAQINESSLLLPYEKHTNKIKNNTEIKKDSLSLSSIVRDQLDSFVGRNPGNKYNWEYGGFETGNGKPSPMKVYYILRSDFIKVEDYTSIDILADDVKYQIHIYDLDENYKETVDWGIKPRTIKGEQLIRIALSHVRDDTITKPKDFLDKLVIYSDKKNTNIKRSSNLFDINSRIDSHAIYVSNDGEKIQGSLFINEDYLTSEWINVIPKKSYTVSKFNRVVYYDENFKYISHENFVDIGKNTFVVPPNCHIIRLHGLKQYILNDIGKPAQVNAGNELLDYEPFYFYFEDKGKPEKDYYFVPEEITGDFVAKTKPYSFLTLTELYNGYDALVADNPEYISKTLLGKDMSGTYELYKYHLKPKQLPTHDLQKCLPKIIINATIHGTEQMAAIATYHLIKAMCEDWQSDPLLEYLRYNVEFVIIPVANPWGYVNNVYQNVNGVNLQMNFPVRWRSGDKNSNTYGGTEPLSELESQYIKSVIDDNKDAMFFVDEHTQDYAGGSVATNWEAMTYVLVRTGIDYLENNEIMAKHFLEKMTRFYKRHYDIPSEAGFMGWIRKVEPGKGTVDAYTTSVGIDSIVIEHFYKFLNESNQYSPDAIKGNIEYMANWLSVVLKRYKDIYFKS